MRPGHRISDEATVRKRRLTLSGKNRRRNPQPGIKGCRGTKISAANQCSSKGNPMPCAAAINPEQQSKYRTRARQLRELAATMKNEHHRKLLVEAAEGYEKALSARA